MRKILGRAVTVVFLLLLGSTAIHAQFDITSQAVDTEGPWSDFALTTLVVPQIADGGITLDGQPSAAEYGGFDGVTVTPGDNAWILNWPPDRQWDDAADSSFTFWLAHDTDYFYIGVDVMDDVVTSDDPNGMFWRDDAIEIVTDVWNDRYDNNTDSSQDAYGGHSYINYEGRFSRWNDETEAIEGNTWSTALDDWTYGEEGDAYGFGEAKADETGWNMEFRYHKRFFEDPEAGIELVEGARMGFNIGLDDDDGFGTGPEGDASRTQDLELQYFWANRQRFLGWTAEEDDLEIYTPEEIADSFERLANGEEDLGELGFYEVGINGGGRLAHGGTGEIIFGGLSIVEPTCTVPADGLLGDFNGNGTVDFPDFLVLSSNFNMDNVGYENGDIDCSGSVNFPDFLAFSGAFGSTVAANAVPEPGSGILLIMATSGMLLVRRRKR